jgi:peptide/nickel transport system permease protein
MLRGTVLFRALIIMLMNLIIDVSYAFLDPRVRYK